MGKLKDNLIEGLTQVELERELYIRYQDQLEYEEWLKTDVFI